MVLAKLKTRSLLSNRRADCTKYTYDASQNRRLMINSGARTTYTCDAANQLNWLQDATGRTTFSYDRNGNQTLERTPAGDRTTYSWDGENRLQVVDIQGNASNYINNSVGQLISRSHNAILTTFTWDRSVIVRKSTNVSNTLCSSLQKDSQCLSYRDTRSIFLSYDSTGNVSRTTDQASTASPEFYFSYFGLHLDSNPLPNDLGYRSSQQFRSYDDGVMYFIAGMTYIPRYERIINNANHTTRMHTRSLTQWIISSLCDMLDYEIWRDCRGVLWPEDLARLRGWIHMECTNRSQTGWWKSLPKCPCFVPYYYKVWTFCGHRIYTK